MTVRVVVVDDSPTMRGLIKAYLQSDPEIEVVGTAGDPYQAREAIKALNPDVITLDVEMPRMDGIAFLEKIMRLRPMPVIIVSTLTKKGAAISVKALTLGAFECVCKPTNASATEAFDELPGLVKAAANANAQPAGMRANAPSQRKDYRPGNKIIAMGSSTGGVEAVLAVLSEFPENCPPTVITQHMPESFTGSFADRLNRECAPKIEEARDGAPLETGRVYIAPGGAAHLEVALGAPNHCRIRVGEKVSGHRPSVDVLFRSVANAFGKRAVGVILSGMGRDGAAGLLEIRENGGMTFGQDEPSCVIYGMPKVAYELGAVQRQLPLTKISRAVIAYCEQSPKSVDAA